MGKLKINGVVKESQDITYDEMVLLCDDFVKRKHRIPINCDFNVNQNLPGVKVFEKLLKEQNINRDEFMKKYSEYKIINFESSNYDDYVEKYKLYSHKEGHPINAKQLKNYNLPTSNWFIIHNINPEVTSWNSFVRWCGYKENNNVSKETAERILKEYDNNTDRPLTQSDLCKVGLSKTTIIKYWGSFSQCKQSLGLKLTPINYSKKTFDDYKERLDNVIQDYKNQGKLQITWNDILHNKYGGFSYDSLKNAFKLKNINVVNYIQDNGLTFWKSGKGKERYYMFPDGESTASSYEYDLSSFLKDFNFIYDRDYTRNCLYKNIIKIDIKNKIDCDYLFYNTFVVEIAGLLTNKNNDWQTCKCKSQREKDYQNKMILKERLLKENNVPFLFLFPEDFQEDSSYQPKIIEFILSNLHKYQLLKKD